MDQHLNAVWQMKIERLIKNLEKNQMKGTFLKDREALQEYMNQQIPDEVKVAVGGSQTLFEIGVIDYLRTRNVTFFDRYEEGLSLEGRKEVFRNSFFRTFILLRPMQLPLMDTFTILIMLGTELQRCFLDLIKSLLSLA